MATATNRDMESFTRRFRALSDPHRLRILDRLRGGERCVCELMDQLDAGQSLLSFHLKTLKDADLVTDRREGRWSYYTLNADAIAEVGEFVDSLGTRVRPTEWRPCCP